MPTRRAATDKRADKQGSKTVERPKLNPTKMKRQEDKDKEDKTSRAETKVDLEGHRQPHSFPSHSAAQLQRHRHREDRRNLPARRLALGRSSDDGPGPNIAGDLALHAGKARAETVLSNMDCIRRLGRWHQSALQPQEPPGRSHPRDDLKPGESNPGKPLNLSQMQTTIDPRAEWKQMYHETWRIERDFLYDPNTHGLVDSQDRGALQALPRRPRFALGVHLSLHRDAGRDHHRPHVRRRARTIPKTSPRWACSAPTTRLRTAATGSPRSSAARTGPRAWPRR